MTELLPQKEIKGSENSDLMETPASGIDQQRLQSLVDLRARKLESVKQYISLKLYHQLADKLRKEKDDLLSQFKQKKAEAARQNREQALPKAFFEQKVLKPKSIRID